MNSETFLKAISTKLNSIINRTYKDEERRAILRCQICYNFENKLNDATITSFLSEVERKLEKNKTEAIIKLKKEISERQQKVQALERSLLDDGNDEVFSQVGIKSPPIVDSPIKLETSQVAAQTALETNRSQNMFADT